MQRGDGTTGEGFTAYKPCKKASIAIDTKTKWIVHISRHIMQLRVFLLGKIRNYHNFAPLPVTVFTLLCLPKATLVDIFVPQWNWNGSSWKSAATDRQPDFGTRSLWLTPMYLWSEVFCVFCCIWLCWEVFVLCVLVPVSCGVGPAGAYARIDNHFFMSQIRVYV